MGVDLFVVVIIMKTKYLCYNNIVFQEFLTSERKDLATGMTLSAGNEWHCCKILAISQVIDIDVRSFRALTRSQSQAS